MAGRQSSQASAANAAVGQRATDFERYVSRGSNRAFVVSCCSWPSRCIFFVRLVFLQVIVRREYSAQAQESRTIGFTVEPRRGTIYDRNGHILAISVEATTIYANPSEIKEPGATSRAIAEALGGTASDYLDAVSQGRIAHVLVHQAQGRCRQGRKLKEQELPGIYFIEDTRREYPYGQTGGQVIGACSVEVDEEQNREYYEGICGMELYYNTILSGTPGYYEAEVGADGTPIPGGVHESTPAVEGQDIVISIDIEFQEEVEADLAADLKRVGVPSGSAVVMDATNGEIYAAASSPFFNPADRSKVPEGSMQLKAATNLFEPGSIFKTVSATAILEEGTMTPDTEVDCPSYIEADGYIVSDAHDARTTRTYSLRDHHQQVVEHRHFAVGREVPGLRQVLRRHPEIPARHAHGRRLRRRAAGLPARFRPLVARAGLQRELRPGHFGQRHADDCVLRRAHQRRRVADPPFPAAQAADQRGADVGDARDHQEQEGH